MTKAKWQYAAGKCRKKLKAATASGEPRGAGSLISNMIRWLYFYSRGCRDPDLYEKLKGGSTLTK